MDKEQAIKFIQEKIDNIVVDIENNNNFYE